MRNISFSMTTDQFIAGTKDVTRRIGWWNLKPGDRVRAVKKCMGLKKGEKMQPLGVIEIISVRKEPLDAITQDDCRREGFPEMTPAQFIDFFLDGNYKGRDHIKTIVNRIEFKKVKDVA